MITAAEARGIRARHDRLKPGSMGFPTNEEISALEIYEFVTKEPSRVFVYYDRDFRHVTTFMGDRLGEIIWKGVERHPFGGKIVSIRVRGINGALYGGVCNLSSGTYCRLRKLKGRR